MNIAIMHRRHIQYVDAVLQKWLMVVLIVLEVALIVGGLFVLHSELSAIIEENLYRVHQPANQGVLDVLLTPLLTIMTGLVAVNVLALAVAEGAWAVYVNSVLTDFRELMARTQALDLRDDPEISSRHEVIKKMINWRALERSRCGAIQADLSAIDTDADFSDPAVQDHALAILRDISKQIAATKSGS